MEEIKLIQKIEDNFLAELEKKNSWGKNEVKALYKDIKIRVYEEHLSEKESQVTKLNRNCKVCLGIGSIDGYRCDICRGTGIM